MSNKTGFFEEALESGKSLAKQTGKASGKAVTDTAKVAVSQTGLPAGGDTATDDFVKDLYGAGKKKPQDDTNSAQNPQAAQVKPQDGAVDSQKSPEEQQKMQVLRSKLHQELHNEVYYDPLVNPKGDKPEERPAEKVEIEKQQEMADLQKKEEEKPPPLAVQRGQRKTEQFPGGGG